MKIRGEGEMWWTGAGKSLPAGGYTYTATGRR